MICKTACKTFRGLYNSGVIVAGIWQYSRENEGRLSGREFSILFKISNALGFSGVIGNPFPNYLKSLALTGVPVRFRPEPNHCITP